MKIFLKDEKKIRLIVQRKSISSFVFVSDKFVKNKSQAFRTLIFSDGQKNFLQQFYANL
jgi:hypothetical protein